MTERRVDDAVAAPGAVLELAQVIERPTQDLYSGRRERLCAFLGAGEADHLVTSRKQISNHR
jgi:hypothetical protein